MCWNSVHKDLKLFEKNLSNFDRYLSNAYAKVEVLLDGP